MGKKVVMLILLLGCTNLIHAYSYTIKNNTKKTIYIKPIAAIGFDGAWVGHMNEIFLESPNMFFNLPLRFYYQGGGERRTKKGKKIKYEEGKVFFAYKGNTFAAPIHGRDDIKAEIILLSGKPKLRITNLVGVPMVEFKGIIKK